MRELLDAAAGHAASYLESLPERPVDAALDPVAARDALDPGLPDGPVDPRRVLDELVEYAEPGVTAMGSPRFFGFVIGRRTSLEDVDRSYIAMHRGIEHTARERTLG